MTFEEYFKANEPFLRKKTLQIMKNPYLADELFSIVVRRVHTNWNKVDHSQEPKKLLTYLAFKNRPMAFRNLHSKCRTWKARLADDISDCSPAQERALIGDHFDIEDRIDREFKLKALDRIMMNRGVHGMVFMMAVNGVTVDQIAKRFGYTTSNCTKIIAKMTAIAQKAVRIREYEMSRNKIGGCASGF